MPTGIILKGIGGFYYVKTPEAVYECKARGVFRKNAVTPLPGDKVHITVSDEGAKTGTIDEIMPRESELVRPAVANVNQIALVIAVKSPAPDFLLLDKLLITAGLKGIAAVVCINKTDLDTDGSSQIISDTYRKAGYKTVFLSSATQTGFEQLREELAGKITVFAGQSGVGKSTIINIVLNSMAMRTGEISDRIERGKHTTRHAEIHELASGGYIVDTPGFSTFELSDIEHANLELYFPEFEAYLGKCRFTGCSHISEPECRVKEAVYLGDIDRGRYEHYSQFHIDLKSKSGFGPNAGKKIKK